MTVVNIMAQLNGPATVPVVIYGMRYWYVCVGECIVYTLDLCVIVTLKANIDTDFCERNLNEKCHLIH